MRITSICIALALTAAPALAQSNIGLDKYPAPKCTVPPPADASLKPAAPPDSPSEAQATIYNSRVRAYNTAMRAHNDGVKTYADCVQAYIAAGKADIARIDTAIKAAADAANAQ